MKVLISAYACEPGQGSEPGVGWTFARAAARRHSVFVLTRANNRDVIEAALRHEPELDLTPVYLDLSAAVRRWKKGRRGVHIYYALWQREALRVARELHEREHFDVGHHVTFGTDWLPADIGRIDGLPFVWGPVGGTTQTPRTLWRWLGWRGVAEDGVRAVSGALGRRVWGDAAARRAAVVVAQNHEVARRFRRHGPVTIEPHVAIAPDEIAASAAGANAEPVAAGRRRAVFSGRAIPWKGLCLAVAAIAEADPAWELHVYGKGPDRARAEQLAATAGVADRVVFHGQVSRSEVMLAVAGADALLHPAMHDSAPWAVAEAITAGTPVVALELGGPAVLVEPDTGVLVRPDGDVAAALARALEVLPLTAPTDRWSHERLGAILDGWYETAVRSARA